MKDKRAAGCHKPPSFRQETQSVSVVVFVCGFLTRSSSEPQTDRQTGRQTDKQAVCLRKQTSGRVNTRLHSAEPKNRNMCHQNKDAEIRAVSFSPAFTRFQLCWLFFFPPLMSVFLYETTLFFIQHLCLSRRSLSSGLHLSACGVLSSHQPASA